MGSGFSWFQTDLRVDYLWCFVDILLYHANGLMANGYMIE